MMNNEDNILDKKDANEEEKFYLDRKRGIFNIARPYIIKYPVFVKAIMGQMIILRAEFIFHKDCIEYVALSDLFKEIKEGDELPIYDIILNDENKIEAKLQEKK